MLFEPSSAVTVTLNGDPMVAVLGAVTEKCVATGGGGVVLPPPPQLLSRQKLQTEIKSRRDFFMTRPVIAFTGPGHDLGSSGHTNSLRFAAFQCDDCGPEERIHSDLWQTRYLVGTTLGVTLYP